MKNRFQSELLKWLREEFPKGTSVELIQMSDPYRQMPAGLKGTVQYVDDAGGIHIDWENGSTLAALYGIDIVKKMQLMHGMNDDIIRMRQASFCIRR